MSLIPRIALLVLAIPFVLAHGDDGNGGNGCGSNQFWWPSKNMCLPNGGAKNPPSPPANTDCPFNWSWHAGAGCCTPHQPNLPPPQCPSGWSWAGASFHCNPPPSRPANKPSTPSNTPGKPDDDCDDDKGGNGKGGNGHGDHKRADIKKRQYRSRNIAPCPKGLSACPVSSLIGGDYECVDTLVDLDNCGGCATLSEGQNCNTIPGVWNVGCEQSACKIYTCAEGYILSVDGKSCNPL